MTDQHAAYTGTIPSNYDEALGPMFFEPYAADLARRVTAGRGASVLEIAAGTGILTRQLLGGLPPDARLVATDLNEPMITFAKTRIAPDPRLEWKTADAGALPFADESFDWAVCQYGVMFFPDKVGALAAARRVLRQKGTLVFNVWGSLADNPFARIVHETVAAMFPADPPQFYTVPFGLHDREQVEHMIVEAGFASVKSAVVDIIGESASADIAARGLVLGTPLSSALDERGGNRADVMRAVATRLAAAGGRAPTRLPMRALVFTAVK
jgi:ubiquinone/menaquinone biosynthesis C-methylase UbiE